MMIVVADFGKNRRHSVAEYALKRYPFQNGESVLLLGEIENMPGHVAVVTRDGKVHFGYHEDTFRQPTEDEI